MANSRGRRKKIRESPVNPVSATSRAWLPTSAPGESGKIYFLVGLFVGLVPEGLSLIGVTINIWLGGILLAVAFGLVVYAFWIWEGSWRFHIALRMATIVIGAAIYFGWTGRQMIAQYRKDHLGPEPHAATSIAMETTVPRIQAATPAPEKVKPETLVPRLKLGIDSVAAGEVQHGKYDGTSVLVIANLINEGAPSIASGWRLTVTLVGGRSVETMPTYLDPSGIAQGDLEDGKGPFKLSLADLLYLKVAEHPIETGSKIRGILMFDFPMYSPDETKKAGTRFVLRCTDFKGKTITAKFTFTGKATPFNWYSGLHPIPH
jgi:hypothetical protein